MCKKVKELYKEAYNVKLSINDFVLEDTEKKFAELIIRDCLSLAQLQAPGDAYELNQLFYERYGVRIE